MLQKPTAEKLINNGKQKQKTDQITDLDPVAETIRLRVIKRANIERLAHRPMDEFNITRSIPFDPDVLKR
jgi:hypothetical protein